MILIHAAVKWYHVCNAIKEKRGKRHRPTIFVINKKAIFLLIHAGADPSHLYALEEKNLETAGYLVYACYFFESIWTIKGECNNTAHLLRRSSRPNSWWSRAAVWQLQRWSWNWCWHSATQSRIPAPMACITLGCWRHRCRCLCTSPGMLSHITCPPSVPMYLRGVDGLQACRPDSHLAWLTSPSSPKCNYWLLYLPPGRVDLGRQPAHRHW